MATARSAGCRALPTPSTAGTQVTIRRRASVTLTATAMSTRCWGIKPARSQAFENITPHGQAIIVNVTAVNDAPTLAGLAGDVSFLENEVNAAPLRLDADVDFVDPDSGFDGGFLVVTGLLERGPAGDPQRGQCARPDRPCRHQRHLWRHRHRQRLRRPRRHARRVLQRRGHLRGDRCADPEPDLCQCQRHAGIRAAACCWA